VLDRVVANYPGKAFVFDSLPELCDMASRMCLPTMDGRFLYAYTDHVSEFGAHRIARRLVPFVEEIARRPD